MSKTILSKIEEEEDNTHYPSSDGKPMSENTLHFSILNYLKNSLDSIFEDKPDVLIAGDLSIYYVQGNPYKKIAPDVMVAFERDKADRGSYIIHKENDIPPVSTFEIVSPSNIKDKPDLWKRWYKYSKMKVKEYFVIHAVKKRGFYIESFKQVDNCLVPMLDFGNHISEYLGIEIFFENGEFVVSTTNGERFNNYVSEVNLRKLAEEAKKWEEEKRKKAEKEKQWEATQRKLAEKAQRKAEKAQRKAEDAKKQEAKKRKLAEERERKAQNENELLKESVAQQMQELAKLRKLLALEVGEEDD